MVLAGLFVLGSLILASMLFISPLESDAKVITPLIPMIAIIVTAVGTFSAVYLDGVWIGGKLGNQSYE